MLKVIVHIWAHDTSVVDICIIIRDGDYYTYLAFLTGAVGNILSS